MPTRAVSVSLSLTSVPCWTATDAMPAPMKPAPSTPIFSIFRGGGTGGVTPGSFLSEFVAKKRKMS